MTNVIIPILVSFLHNLFTVLWIGGMIIMGFVLIPLIRKMMPNPQERKAFLWELKKRLRIVILICIIGLFATGLLMTRRSQLASSIFSTENQYSIFLFAKHILYFLMAVIAIFRGFVLEHLTIEKKLWNKINILTLFVNILFGIIVLFFSSYTAILSSLI